MQRSDGKLIVRKHSDRRVCHKGGFVGLTRDDSAALISLASVPRMSLVPLGLSSTRALRSMQGLKVRGYE